MALEDSGHCGVWRFSLTASMYTPQPSFQATVSVPFGVTSSGLLKLLQQICSK